MLFEFTIKGKIEFDLDADEIAELTGGTPETEVEDAFFGDPVKFLDVAFETDEEIEINVEQLEEWID